MMCSNFGLQSQHTCTSIFVLYLMRACRCATRINFLADAENVSKSFNETFQLINLERWLDHVAICPDPMCGRVFCVDGTCKVTREICGAPLEPPEHFLRSESDVQNVLSRHCLRQQICDELPVSRKTGPSHCDRCHKKHSGMSRGSLIC